MSSIKLSPRIAAPICAALLLSACGGGGISGVGSSSGGGNPVLAGTLTAPGSSSRGGDGVFGAVDTDGNGFFADLNGSSRAIFAFGSASQNSQLAGTFAAYAANGSNLGDASGSTLQQGQVSGTVGTQSGVTSATVTFANGASGFSNSATLVLDHPPLALATLATAAGTYKATTGAAAIASSALSVSGSAVYTVTLSSAGVLTVTNDAGCSLLNGNAVPDANYNIYALHVSGTCSSTAVTLDGLAVFLPAGSPSPLGGGNLAAGTLVVELSDFLASPSSPQYALALVASRQ